MLDTELNEINEILKQFNFKVNTEDIICANEGYNNKVYIIPSKNFAIKIIRKSEENAKNELHAYSLLNKKDSSIPIPKIITSDFTKKIIPHSYIVMEKLPGITLSKYVENNSNPTAIFYQLGVLKSKINSITSQHFGSLDEAETYDLITHFEEKFNKIMLRLEKNDFEKHFIESQRIIFNQNKDIVTQDFGPCFCHGDTTLNNILIENDSISGILDFEYAKWGTIIRDIFGSVRSFSIFEKYQDDIMRGYKSSSEIPKKWKSGDRTRSAF